MKKIVTLFMIILFANFSEAQNKDYQNLWNKIAKFEKEGLTQSALKTVEEIHAKAQSSSNSTQIVKSLLYKSKYTLILEEEAQLKIVNDFKTQIQQSALPVKNVLQSMLANLYWDYYKANRYQFYNRTKTQEKVDETDFRTWDLETLFTEINTYFQYSLVNKEVLQKTNLSKFDALLNLQENSKTYRPTLFDLLSNNALAFFQSQENSITKPAYKFEIDNEAYLSDIVTFSKVKIESKDTTSLSLQALQIYQELEQFHLKNNSVKALVDVHINRLKYVKQHAVFLNKDKLFLQALQHQSKHFKGNAVSGLYDFEIATLYVKQGQEYVPITKTENQWKNKEAFAICNAVIANFPESKAAKKCIGLRDKILQQSLQITTEKHLPLDKEARLLIRYKNINELSFGVYKISENEIEKLNKTYAKGEQLKFIKKLEIVNKWQNKLPNQYDYQTHTTEVVFPKLTNGRYIVLANPLDHTKTFAYALLQVTNLAVVESYVHGENVFQVINRNNGKPIPEANVKVTFLNNYNNAKNVENLITNAKGKATITKNIDRSRNVKIEVTYKNEKAFFGNYYIHGISRNIKEDQENRIGFLFTDRSIYRPGQTVFFKGIALKRKKNISQVLPGTKITVTLKDANYQEVKSQTFTTNAYGSIQGEFVLPSSGLTGNHFLSLTSEQVSISGGVNFSVEEYKRPKFEAKFLPITKTFQVNDSVLIKGNAIAYAGSAISDAKVVYRVHRKVQNPSWYYWHRPYFVSAGQEITHGESITNSKGEFEIKFLALPDQSVAKKSLPVFQYEILADITDVNGETRSVTTIVNVGYHALLANIIVPGTLDKNKKDHEIKIDTKNLNGEFVSAKGTIKMYKLIAPKTVLRPRSWAAPDYQNITENQFKTLFPNDAYKNENSSNTWDKGTLVFHKKFNTAKSKTLALNNIKNWESGKYILVLESIDKYGQEVKDEIKIDLYSNADNTIADNQLFQISSNKESYQEGEIAIVNIASAAKNIYLTIAIEKQQEIVKQEIIRLDNNKKTIRIPVEKQDIGGFVIHYSFSAFNSYTSGTLNIVVPYPETQLEIETVTFRDKLQPGVNETWSFKIKGPQGEKVSAELLASMYDASLNQFLPHQWRFNPIQQPNYNSNTRLNARNSFGVRAFKVHNKKQIAQYNNTQFYDALNWFGLSFGYNNQVMFSQKRRALMPNAKQVVSDNLEVAALEESIVGEFAGEGMASNQNNVEKSQADTSLDFNKVTIRKNLQETAFFFPQLQTDAAGNVSFSFTTPEALTKWNLQLLAHTKDLNSTITKLETVTQKELMVIPNAPRFLREGDEIVIRSKIANLTEKALSGEAVLQLFDALTGERIDKKLFTEAEIPNPNYTGNYSGTYGTRQFTVDANGNTQVSWLLYIPDDVQAVQYKIIAQSGAYSDGEQNALPVLSNRMLVTETLPMWIRSNETKTFTLNKLKEATSSTLKHHNLALEITSNPAWYAVQALPYLMEYPHDCNEQIFSRYYANALASHIVNSNPRIQEVFNQWKNTEALLSNLEKNQELKSLLIQETPWLRDAQSETEQKKRIALLFDLNKMKNELASAKRKLEQNQMHNGAWSWFAGGRENRYITQHIISGFGHLAKLGVFQSNSEESIINNAISYLDDAFVQEYKDIKKYNKNVDLSKDHLSNTQLHYLYMRSFFPEINKSKEVQNITNYYKTQIEKYWLSRSLYAKGMMALVAERYDDNQTAKTILKSLKENSITSEELGMYWKENTNSWYLYQAPIETQALLIEAFTEVGISLQSEAKNIKDIDNLKIWLLKNKQTNRWKTTKATTEAVYALLLQGSDWLSVTDLVDIEIGKQAINAKKME
ncbi:MAG: alpha-2-macroglobulin family protein, partial [Oceanihabitans sp.]